MSMKFTIPLDSAPDYGRVRITMSQIMQNITSVQVVFWTEVDIDKAQIARLPFQKIHINVPWNLG